MRQCTEDLEDLHTVLQVAAGKLADDMRMAEDSTALEKTDELLVASLRPFADLMTEKSVGLSTHQFAKRIAHQ